MPKKYFLSFNYVDLHTAGDKAKNDANAIFEKKGFEKVGLIPKFARSGKIASELSSIIFGISKLLLLKKGSIIVQNFPPRQGGEAVVFSYFNKIKQGKNFKTILLIHDIYELRTQNWIKSGSLKEEVAKLSALKQADYLISHNEKMTAWLIQQGFQAEKIVDLGLFDYLAQPTNSGGTYGNQIIIAGTLSSEKAGYLEQLTQIKGLDFELYGPGLDEKVKALPAVHYQGSFPSEQIINEISGSYGLVWDGDTLAGGGGMNALYQKYNNPHKVSLYLAAGFPVIMWKEAALAPMIENNKVGITIDNLNELPEKLANISQSDYDIMKRNVQQLGEKVRSGAFLSAALDKVNQLMEKNHEV